MIVGECLGKDEQKSGSPFTDTAGWCLNKMLEEAGLHRGQAFLSYVVREYPEYGDVDRLVSTNKRAPGADWTRDNSAAGLWLAPAVAKGRVALLADVSFCRPNVIIACGDTALWALTGYTSAAKWRGSLLVTTFADDFQALVIPTLSPRTVLRDWSTRPIVVQDLRRAVAELSAGPAHVFPPKRYILRPTIEQVRGWFDNLRGQLQDFSREKPFHLPADIETRAGHTACIGFATSISDAICIPLMCVERNEGYWTVDEEAEIVFLLYELAMDERVVWVGQNFLYDCQYLHRHWHFRPKRVLDIMIGHHAMFSNQRKSLDYQASLYSDHYIYWKDDGKEWDPSIPEDDYWEYNCDDNVYTFQCMEGQALAEEALTVVWPKLPEVRAFQQRMFQPVLKTMIRGVRQRPEPQTRFEARLSRRSTDIQNWLNAVTGQEFNVRSSPQMKDFFYEQCAQTKNWKRGKPGQPSTLTCDDAALEKIYDREPLLRPVIRQIQALRSVGVFLSTFVRMQLDSDGRIRCSFNVAGTLTYRFSSSKNAFNSGTNLQNIPAGDDDEDLTLDQRELALPNVREMFGPDPGMTWFDMDLDSADLRIVTAESGCRWMKQAFAAKLKPYVEIAKEYYRDPTITKSHPAYKLFKALCHGSNYLGTPPGLAQRIGLLVHEVERIQKWYFEVCPEIRRWQEDLKRQVDSRRYVENIFGYRCWITERIEANTYNAAVAWIPQSTVGRIINGAYVNIDENLPWAQVLLQVHDSLDGQFPTEMGQAAVDVLTEQAQIVLPYAEPIVVPVGFKVSPVSWGHCEDAAKFYARGGRHADR